MTLHLDFPYPLYLVVSEKDCVHFPIETVVEEAILGGVDIVQLREKEATAAAFLALAQRIKRITDRYQVPLIINDAIHIAKQINAFGVHVGNSDLPPTEVRKLLGEKSCIGYSLEYWKQLDTAESICADYLAASPVFSTATKTDTVTQWGLEGVSKIKQQTAKPLVAIGNIHCNNAADIIKAGADSIAVVSEICASENPRKAAEQLKEIINQSIQTQV